MSLIILILTIGLIIILIQNLLNITEELRSIKYYQSQYNRVILQLTTAIEGSHKDVLYELRQQIKEKEQV